MRNTVAFHYDPDLTRDALEDRASRPESKRSQIFRGDELALWRFQVADDVLDSIVTRHVWKIPRGSDLRAEADRLLDYAAGLGQAFLTFSAEFASLYVEKFAAA